MPLLADYAITPDVFDVTSYSTAGECAAHRNDQGASPRGSARLRSSRSRSTRSSETSAGQP